MTCLSANPRHLQVREELDLEQRRADELAHSYALLQGRWEKEGAAHTAALADMRLQIQSVRAQKFLHLPEYTSEISDQYCLCLKQLFHSI